MLINSSGSVWDLVINGASTTDTQQSLVNTASALQNTFTLQNTVLANSFSYDCNVFGANNVCVSAGGRNTAVSAANGLNNTSALLIAAYRVIPSVRVGAYADQNLSVNNAGSTVNLGNNTPLIGLFGAWNERLDGKGAEVKISAAYGQKNTTVTRPVVGTSEAGSGSSQLNSQGAQVVAKYGFGVVENVIVSPYVGMRYTQNNMGGYIEGASATVTAPLAYSSLNTNATTALAGVGAQYRFIPQATLFASAGVETDTNTSNGTYSATGIAGLTPINFNANPVKTRPTATLGATYDVEKNQRIGLTGIYRQEPYQAVSTTTVMATYTIGL
ncbi:autotransporter outer membrane beta-barrel domain-containing protein [Polynucleobacter necessarius]|uniref:autotransporter outer membrane beta-barrel domain-containing protein n=1 Tax=Polynucleobacter necessarius TaxID=576610 RepID=UPI000E0917C3|nr:autotransporter outer membrane beta-barrel domain-containing protein [Polynucleobacter necessarius]